MIDVEIAPRGTPQTTLQLNQVGSVGEVIRQHASDADVTLTIEPERKRDKVILALSHGMAFLALEKSGSVFQFRSSVAESGSKRMSIAGQQTNLDAAYVVLAETAASVVEAWLWGVDDELTLGTWDPR